MTQNTMVVAFLAIIIAVVGGLFTEFFAPPRVTNDASCFVSGVTLDPAGQARASAVRCNGLGYTLSARGGLRDVEARLKDSVRCKTYRYFGRFAGEELRGKDWVSDCVPS